MHQNLLKYKNYRYLKLSLTLIIVSLFLYFSQGQDQPANGGTYQGYILGIFAAFLILLLTYLGIRKRSYSSTAGNVEGWTSAHVFLGASLLLIASLHAAFQVGWNIHTLAYVLMIIVILSGFYGLFAYMHYPRVLMTNNIGGTQETWLEELSETDEKIKSYSSACSGNVRLLALSAIENTVLGGGLLTRMRGKDNSKIQLQNDTKQLISNKHQERIIETLANAIPNSSRQKEAEALNIMLTLFSRRQRLLKTCY